MPRTARSDDTGSSARRTARTRSPAPCPAAQPPPTASSAATRTPSRLPYPPPSDDLEHREAEHGQRHGRHRDVAQRRQRAELDDGDAAEDPGGVEHDGGERLA